MLVAPSRMFSNIAVQCPKVVPYHSVILNTQCRLRFEKTKFLKVYFATRAERGSLQACDHLGLETAEILQTL